MRTGNLLKLIIAVAIAEFAGVAGSLLTGSGFEWYAGLAKPALTPPSAVFGPVWTVLYLLMGSALFIAWKNDWKTIHPIWQKNRKAWNPISERLWTGDWQKMNVIAVFGVQYILNILWPFVFFCARSPGLAFFAIIALWCSIVYVIINFYRISKAAAYLLLPYLAWVTFAAYLNYAIWMLNS